MIKIYKIKEDINIRLDKYLKTKFTSLTQSYIEKNIRKKKILINNSKTMSKYIIKENDELKILNFNDDVYKNKIIFKKNIIINKKTLDLFEKSIIFENKKFIILNKWSSISTQSGSKIRFSIDDIVKKFSSENRLVHRLDKETSGLLIIAKNLNYAKIFGNLFKSKLIEKSYLAICEGRPKLKESFVNLDLTNKFNKIDKTETYYKILQSQKGVSLILFKPKTGKTHQIRRVSKNIGAPIIGDLKYNASSKFKNENLKLNAHQLRFVIKDKSYSFSSELPTDFLLFIKKHNIRLPKKIL